MKRWIRGVIVLALLAAPMNSAYSEEITKTSGGFFQAAIGNANVTMQEGEEIQIIASNYMAGKISIETHAGQDAVFKYRKILNVKDENMAEEFAQVIEVSIERSGGLVKLFLKSPNPAPWSETDYSGRIEGELSIPPNCRVELEAVYFNLTAEGDFSVLRNKSSFGEMKVSGVHKELDLSSSNRSISVNDIQGEITINTNYADIKVKDIVTGGAPAYISNENGNITIDNIIGAFDVRNDFGKVNIENAVLSGDRSRVRGSYSPISIDIEAIKGAGLTVRNNNEDIELRIPEESSADYSLKVDGNGEINAEGMSIVPTYVDYNRLDFKTGEGDSRIRISVGGKGNINIEGH